MPAPKSKALSAMAKASPRRVHDGGTVYMPRSTVVPIKLGNGSGLRKAMEKVAKQGKPLS